MNEEGLVHIVGERTNGDARITARPEREPEPTQLLETVQALARCSFLPVSSDKRFARDIASLITGDGSELSPRQKAHVLRLAYKYRRQMSRALVPAERPPHAWESSCEDTEAAILPQDGSSQQ